MSRTHGRRAPKRAESHVRLYAHELACPAYRTLSANARALLIEFRALFGGRDNRVYLSVRQMQERLSIGQRPAVHARDELLERGWIKVIEPGAFHRKTKLATVYALTNEPLEDRDGATAPKDFMRWQPGQRFFTVADLTKHGSQNDYRDPSPKAQKGQNSSQNGYRKHEKSSSMVVNSATQIGYQAQRSEQALAVCGSAVEQSQ